jgi:hypothetical protein
MLEPGQDYRVVPIGVLCCFGTRAEGPGVRFGQVQGRRRRQ